MHVALPAQIVVVGAAMHRAAIIPHDEIVQAPAMGVNELALRGVRDQSIDKRGTGGLGHAAMSPACDAR